MHLVIVLFRQQMAMWLWHCCRPTPSGPG